MRKNDEESRKKVIPMIDNAFKMPRGEKPYLIGGKCKSCGCVSFPKRVMCPACAKEGTIEEMPLSRVGKLYSFTVARVAPMGFKPPYVVGDVELPEGIRLFSIITNCDPSEEELKIGMDLELVIEKFSEDERGNDIVGYMFRPIKKGKDVK